RAGRCLGINAVYLRSLNTALGPIPVGYWAHLYVRPSARKLMIYPRLVLEMMRWSRDAGLQIVYTGSRQQHVAAAHLQMGFQRLATLPVLIQPLRPATLVAARKAPRSPLAQVVAREIDRFYRGACRSVAAAVHGRPPVSDPVSCECVNAIVAEGFCSPENAHVRTAWNVESWRRRFSATIEGDRYACFALPDADRPEAGLLMRVAERGSPSVRVGVLMDIFDKTPDTRHLRPLLRAAARTADDAGCAGVIAIEQTTSSTAAVAAMRAEGYLRTSERYDIEAKAVGENPLPSQIKDASAWLFNFGEHDAF
ncbi:MAG: hypothetical protein ACK52C_05975, partial [Planctomycetia bacterium]